MKRRELINTAIAAGTVAALNSTTVQAVDASPAIKIIDTNVSLFRWPFRRLPLDEPELLIEKLHALGIAQAWAGSFEGILHRDIAGVNRRLAAGCEKHPELVPIGSVNPALPDWGHDLRQCVEVHKMPGIRLHPNYHGYTLSDSRFIELIELAAVSGLFVQIAAALEDTRTQLSKVRAPDVDLEPLPNVIRGTPDARIQILNWRPRGALLDQLAEAPGVFFDTARVESTDGVATLLKAVSRERVLFGTHAPFLIPEAALIRVHESDLPDEKLRSILRTNAEKLLKA